MCCALLNFNIYSCRGILKRKGNCNNACCSCLDACWLSQTLPRDWDRSTQSSWHRVGDDAFRHKGKNNIFLPKQGEWNKLHEENDKQFSENDSLTTCNSGSCTFLSSWKFDLNFWPVDPSKIVSLAKFSSDFKVPGLIFLAVMWISAFLWAVSQRLDFFFQT